MLSKEFKRITLRELSKIPENTDRHFNEIMKTIHNINEKVSKEIDIMKKIQVEFLELKN
jgi:DNA-binding HxlR family transcriptional regulator